MRRILLLLVLLLTPVLCGAQAPHAPALPHDARAALLTFLRALFPELRATAAPVTYYVAPGGSDSGACTQSAPCKTLATAIAKMAGGDTLYLRAGTYAEHIGYPNKPFPPSGLSWDQPTTIAGYPGERAVLKPTGVPAVISFLSGFQNNLYHYIVFTNLVIDGSGITDTTVYLGSNDYIRLTNAEVFGNTRGTNISGSGSFNEFRGLTVRNASGYGWYWSGRDSLFEGNMVTDNGGYGMHIYSSEPDKYQVHRNTVRGNTFKGNGKNFTHSGTGQAQKVAAIIISSGGGHKVINNVIVQNAKGVQVDYSSGQSVGHQVLNNTITGNETDGVFVGSTVSGAVVRNNIVWGNGVPLTDQGTGTLADHNLTSDPLFVGAGDYHLSQGSQAVDAGVTIATVTTDLEGTVRPQGAGYDIGAYERVGSTPVPPEPPPVGSLALACTGELGAKGVIQMTCTPQPGARR